MFGDFPHDGKLSPLWFRLIKRGLPLPIDQKNGKSRHFAVGEGQKQYFTYICEKTGRDGQRLLITQGVDLLAGHTGRSLSVGRNDRLCAKRCIAVTLLK